MRNLNNRWSHALKKYAFLKAFPRCWRFVAHRSSYRIRCGKVGDSSISAGRPVAPEPARPVPPVVVRALFQLEPKLAP